jgi:catechol 2,3-dioxygenase
VPIDPRASIGTVHLTVSDLDRSVAFYRDRLGMVPRSGASGEVRLKAPGDGAAGNAGSETATGPSDLLALWPSPGAPRVRGATGLYHFAILVPSRLDLARTLAHLRDTRTRLTGASDHLVSEALYLDDPEANGIEIYRDRPRAEWPLEEGGVRMAVDPLDLDALLAEADSTNVPWTGLAPGTRMGHIHLRVSDLPEAERFYVGALGFEVMARYGDSALFVSAGRYHHHIGLNTWAGVGAHAPPPGAAGLREYVVRLPVVEERDRVAAQARAAGYPAEATAGGAHSLRDPSSNRIVLSAVA